MYLSEKYIRNVKIYKICFPEIFIKFSGNVNKLALLSGLPIETEELMKNNLVYSLD